MCSLYVFIIIKSFSINTGFKDSFEQVLDSADKIKEKYNEITELKSSIEAINKEKFDVENFDYLQSGVERYYTSVKTTSSLFNVFEQIRNLYTVLLFVFYIIIFLLSLLAFFKNWPKWILAFSVILLFTIPMVILYTGFLGSYFFLYSDFCGSVYSAIHENEMPIYGKGLGYITSCFDIVKLYNLENPISDFYVQL